MEWEHNSDTHVEVKPVEKKVVKKIWRVALILGIITTIEFILAFTMKRGPFLVSIFVGLTLVKAFYIVSEFMHLKYERKVLIWSIILPLIFVVWLIIALLYEGSAIFDARN